MDIQDLSIAVVGGGYGGASAAIALAKQGARDVTVYEQAPATGNVGAGIGLRPSSVELFRRWGIFDAIAAVSDPSEFLEILTADGRHVIAHEAWPQIDDFAQHNATRIIHRAAFIEALTSCLPEGVLRLDHRLTGIVDHGSSATLTFANGATATHDVVIGADGIRSTVRGALFTDAQPIFAHEHAYRVVIPIEQAHGLVTDSNPRFYMGENGVIAYNLPLPIRGELSYDITAPSDDESWAPVITNESLVELLQGFDERIVAVAAEVDIPSVTSRGVYDIDPVDVWHTDSVALLGDAAHAMLHHQGQGANSAIADAGALADAFAEAGSVAEALARYQAVRKPVTDELQRISRAGWNAAEIDDAFPGQR